MHGCVGKYPHRIRGKKDGIGGLGKVNWERHNLMQNPIKTKLLKKKKKNGWQHASKSRNALQSGRENETL